MAEAAKLMAGKRGIVFGVANNRSIAWGITKAVTRPGRGGRAHLSGRRHQEAGRAACRRDRLQARAALRRDRRGDASRRCSRRSPRHGARSTFWSMPSPSPTRRSSTGAMSTPPRTISPRPCSISCYSFTALAKRAEKLMPNGGSLLTLTYYGAEKVMPHYNVMGVAKAALEASVRYLAADLGKENDPRQRHLGRADQDARGIRHRRLPLYPQVERVQLAAPAHRVDRGCRRAARSISSPTSAAASPARSCISTPATTWSA